MRRVKIEAFCDLCYIDLDTETLSTRTWTIGLADNENRPALYVLETCEAHTEAWLRLKEIIPQLAPYQEASRQNTPAAAPALFTKAASGPGSRGPRLRDENGNHLRKTPADACEICGVELTRSGLIQHVYNRHANTPKPEYPTECPDCTYVGSSQVVGNHRTAQHGYNSLEEAYKAAGLRRKHQRVLAG